MVSQIEWANPVLVFIDYSLFSHNSPEPDPELYLIGMSDMTKEKTLLSEEKCIQQNL
jgi:hypothetical protein